MDLRATLQTYKKPLILFFVCCLIATISWFGFTTWRSRTYATLVIEAAPLDLTMILDGKEFKSPKTIYIKPGDYRPEFFRENFSTQTRKVRAEKGKKVILNVPLYAVNDAGKEYVANNPGVARRLELIGGRYENERTTALTNNFPVIKILPITRRDFIIDYSLTNNDGESIPRFRITHAGKIGKNNAEKWFTDNGYTASDYDVAYIDISKISQDARFEY